MIHESILELEGNSHVVADPLSKEPKEALLALTDLNVLHPTRGSGIGMRDVERSFWTFRRRRGTWLDGPC